MAEKLFDVLDWKIVNLNCWSQAVHGKSITSPDVLGTTLIRHVELFPRGESGQDDHMTVRFCGANIAIKCNLSFIGFDGSVISFHPGNITDENESFPGPKFEDIVTPKRGMKDEMTLRVYLLSYENFEQHMCTTIGVREISCKVDRKLIENFDSNVSLDILYFRYFPEQLKGIDLIMARQNKRIQFGMEAWIMEKENPVLITIKTDIISKDNVLIRKENTKHVFIDDESWTFLKLKESEETGTAIILHLKIVNGETIHSYNYISFRKEVSLETENTCLLKLESSNDSVSSNQSDASVTVLSKELMCLFQDHDYSDFNFKCGNVTYPVHKNILSARSPVFKTMLSCDMTESASGQVDITDLEPSTLALFLTFLYTGAVEEKELDGDSAFNLYYAADKYQVPSLKRDCADFLSANIVISNVCDVLSLADKHKDDSLVTVCHNFLLGNHNEVMESNVWARFVEKEPMLALKTLNHFAQKKYVVK